MVAYSFKARFAEPILAGTKRQTIRAVGKRRHAVAGDKLQLYVGMRTKHCRKIADKVCLETIPIAIMFDDDDESEGIVTPGFGFPGGLEGFAIADGFSSWADMKAFWRKNHPGVDLFEGVLVRW